MTEQFELTVNDRKDPLEWMHLPDGRWVKRWRPVRTVTAIFDWDRFEVYEFCRRDMLRSRKESGRNCHLWVDLKSAWALKERLEKVEAGFFDFLWVILRFGDGRAGG